MVEHSAVHTEVGRRIAHSDETRDSHGLFSLLNKSPLALPARRV